MKLKINQKIVHSSYGVGKINKITAKKISGKTRFYYTVKTEKMTYWLPMDRTEFENIRPVRAPSTFANMLSIIRKKPRKLPNNFRTRIKYIKDQIGKCTLKAKAKIIRDLHARNVKKPLHINESRIFEKQKFQFANEWSISAGIDREEAARKLDEALSISASKLPKS